MVQSAAKAADDANSAVVSTLAAINFFHGYLLQKVNEFQGDYGKQILLRNQLASVIGELIVRLAGAQSVRGG